MKREVELLEAGGQRALRRRLKFVGLYVLITALSISLLLDFLEPAITAECGEQAICRWFSKAGTLNAEATATLLAALIGALYVLRQFSMTTKPHLDARLQSGKPTLIGSGMVAVAWIAAVHNNGGGPAFVEDVRYTISLDTGDSIASASYDEAHAFFVQAGMVDDVTFDLCRYMPGSCIRAGSSATLLELDSQIAGSKIRECNIGLWFQDSLGDQFVKLIVCIPASRRRPIQASVPPTTMPDNNSVG